MAQKGQAAILAIGTAVSGTAIAVTAATNASPPVLTTATNTFINGDILVGAGFSGFVGANGRAFSGNPVTATSVTLKGEDATDVPTYGAYVSGGTLQKWTMTPVVQITGVKGFDGQAGEIDITHLQSLAKEILLGLQDFGNVNLDLFLVNADTGQKAIRSARQRQAIVPWSLTLASGEVTAFMAGVKQFSFDGVKPDGAVSGSIVLRVTSAPAWFA